MCFHFALEVVSIDNDPEVISYMKALRVGTCEVVLLKPWRICDMYHMSHKMPYKWNLMYGNCSMTICCIFFTDVVDTLRAFQKQKLWPMFETLMGASFEMINMTMTPCGVSRNIMPPTAPCRFTWPTLRNLAAMLLDHFGDTTAKVADVAPDSSGTGYWQCMGDREAGTYTWDQLPKFHFKSRGRNRVDTGFSDL